MNLFITILLYAASVVGSIWFVKSRLKKPENNFLPSRNGMMSLLEEGKNGIKSRIKDYSKKPLDNPDVKNKETFDSTPPVFNNNGMQANPLRTFEEANRKLEDLASTMNRMNRGSQAIMNGKDKGGFVPPTNVRGGESPTLPMNRNDGRTTPAPTAIGVTQVGAIANAIPIANSISQVGAIANVAPSKIVGPMMQTGLVLNGEIGTLETMNQLTNMGLNSAKKIARLNQMANTNMNYTKRIGSVTSNGQTAIIGPRGWINYRQIGTSNLYGHVNRAMLSNGTINANKLQIKGYSKVETIVEKKFTDPSGKIAAVRKGELPNVVIKQGPNIGIALNDALVQKNNKYDMKNERLFLSQDQHQQLAMLELKKVYMNPENNGMNHNQLVKLASFNRNRLLSDNPNRGGDEAWYRSALMSLPTGLGNNEIEKIAHKAKSLKDAVDRNSSMLAVARTDYKMGDPNKNALNNVLKETSSITRNFYNYLERNNPNENITNINEDEMKDIEKKARENVEARGDLSLEDKEKQYEAEVQKQVEDEKQRKMEEAEDSLKEEILSNPELAKEVLGEKGQEALEKEIDKVKKKRKDTYKEYLKRQESMKDEQFAKNHPEISNANKYEVRKKRYEYERRRFIEKAAESEDISADYNTVNNVRYYSENLLKAE